MMNRKWCKNNPYLALNGTYRSFLAIILVFTFGCSTPKNINLNHHDESSLNHQVLNFIEESSDIVLAKAEEILRINPDPITNYQSERSAGGLNDFYSEGDYWWMDPENPEGPYIRKDGLTNPANFTAHRKAMRNLNEWVSTLVAAYLYSGEEKYARHALKHLHAFFIDPYTRMNPNLLYAQAIKGRFTGRGIGIIDTIHLIEVARAIEILIEENQIPDDIAIGLINWFGNYNTWLNQHPYGLDEKEHGNNHSTWWAAQVMAFGSLAHQKEYVLLGYEQAKKLLNKQMSDIGSFPEELARTKPYNYSLFNLEGYAIIGYYADKSGLEFWNYETDSGKVEKAFNYMKPYLRDKSKWPHPKDVSHFDEIPVRSVGLMLALLGFEDTSLFETWKVLDAEKKSEEVKRNFPLWQPVLWINSESLE